MFFKTDVFKSQGTGSHEILIFLGIMIFSAVAYFIQHWRVLAQVQSGIGVLLLPIMLFVPESPRWLVAKQKYEHADKACIKR